MEKYNHFPTVLHISTVLHDKNTIWNHDLLFHLTSTQSESLVICVAILTWGFLLFVPCECVLFAMTWFPSCYPIQNNKLKVDPFRIASARCQSTFLLLLSWHLTGFALVTYDESVPPLHVRSALTLQSLTYQLHQNDTHSVLPGRYCSHTENMYLSDEYENN